MSHDTQSVQMSQKHDGRNVYAIMKTMCPSCYHHNGFVATDTFGHTMYSHNRIYIHTLCTYIYFYTLFHIYTYTLTFAPDIYKYIS